VNLEYEPERAARLCGEAHARLQLSVAQLSDEAILASSNLPGWTVGHVLTHLARNADAHARRLEGTLRGEDVPKYANGPEQRRSEIDDGAGRSAQEILGDLETSCAQLEEVFAQCAAAGWPNGHFLGGAHYGASGCPAHRLREVEMHHVDLRLGYTPLDWPDDYVAWDLQEILYTVPERLGSPRERRQFMAWLAGRGPLDAKTTLTPW
jgi:maleylpyruvate isomerase